MMDNTNSFNLLTVAALLQRVIDDYKTRGIHGVSFEDKDTYWNVTTDEMFDFSQEPSTFAVGSLDDDLDELTKLIADPDRQASAVDLERIGNVLKAISEVLTE